MLLMKANDIKIKYQNQYPGQSFDNLKLSMLNESEIDPHETIENFNIKDYGKRLIFGYNEYSFRIEYDSFEPTSLSNAYHDLEDTLIAVNRKFNQSEA